MVPAKSSVAIAATLVSLVVGVHPAAAEWFADLYGGAVFTRNHHFSLDGKLDGVAVAGLVANVSFDESFSLGGRGGYWFESFKFFGLGLDVSHFRPDISSQTKMGKGTITDTRGALFGVPINVSGARPVKLREVDLFITAASFDLMFRWPMLVGTNFPTHGVQVGGGVLWEFTRNIGVFSEYRHTHIRAALNSGEITFRTHLSTHHLLSGVSVRF